MRCVKKNLKRHTEIERKFIVTDSTFKQSAVRIMDIRQGYVGTSSNGEARVSIRGLS